MIRAVLFDVGGTLHEVHREPELALAFCSELLEKLIAQTGKKHQLKIRLRKAEAQFRDRK